MVEYKILYCVVLVKIFHKLLVNFAKLVTTKTFEKKFKYLYIYMNWGKICIKNQVKNKNSKSLTIVDDGHYLEMNLSHCNCCSSGNNKILWLIAFTTRPLTARKV